MKEEINVGQFRLPLFLVVDPAFVHTENVVKNFFAQSGDEDLVLLDVRVKSQRSQELPNRLVDDVDGTGRRGWLSGNVGMSDAGRREEKEEMRCKELEQMVKHELPVRNTFRY